MYKDILTKYKGNNYIKAKVLNHMINRDDLKVSNMEVGVLNGGEKTKDR